MYLENICFKITHVTSITLSYQHIASLPNRCMLFDKLGQGPLKPSSYNIF